MGRAPCSLPCPRCRSDAIGVSHTDGSPTSTELAKSRADLRTALLYPAPEHQSTPVEPATVQAMERRASGSLILGLLLVLVGAAYLFGQYVPRPLFAVDLGHYGWPLFVIVPGLALL